MGFNIGEPIEFGDPPIARFEFGFTENLPRSIANEEHMQVSSVANAACVTLLKYQI